MIKLKKSSKIIISFLIVNYLALLSGLVYAQTCVGGGGLAITSLPSAMEFPNIEVNLTDDTVHSIASNGSLAFEDMRGESLSFSLNISATDFTDAAKGNSFSVTNLKVASDENDTITEVECDDSTGMTIIHTDFSAFTGQGIDQTLVTGDARERIGRYSVTPEYELTIPASTPASDYVSTLTFTIL